MLIKIQQKRRFMSGIICNAGGTAGIHVPSRRYSNDEYLRGGIFRFPSISAPWRYAGQLPIT